MKKIKLSILMCSVPSRLKKFKTLEFMSELAAGLDVEVLYLGDNQLMSVGRKRNLLMHLASGEYLTFADDDDRVSPTFISDILQGLHDYPNIDCLTYKESVSINKEASKICIKSKIYGINGMDNKENYLRIPDHRSVWKKSIVERFPELNFGEDAKFAEKMYKKGYTEAQIDKVLYFYDFDKSQTLTQ